MLLFLPMSMLVPVGFAENSIMELSFHLPKHAGLSGIVARGGVLLFKFFFSYQKVTN
jgi:hypothetical protein